ncbi:hypothetical protein [Salmonirosea aquatica]|uniref:Uncharacterized protein n=1 Tax=Salmonirosea aquatica TaxID=2654236 RepID=A0A7C9FQ99_9BACT|nr:hypothetical protein [Cytophagaceae bacterium SJW1-29]
MIIQIEVWKGGLHLIDSSDRPQEQITAPSPPPVVSEAILERAGFVRSSPTDRRATIRLLPADKALNPVIYVTDRYFLSGGLCPVLVAMPGHFHARIGALQWTLRSESDFRHWLAGPVSHYCTYKIER